jgi:hypothetical protein
MSIIVMDLEEGNIEFPGKGIKYLGFQVNRDHYSGKTLIVRHSPDAKSALTAEWTAHEVTSMIQCAGFFG